MNPAFLKRVKRNDQIAKWIITIGGMAIIFSVIFILLLIAKVSFPLFLSPDKTLHARFQLERTATDAPILAVGMDEYLETAYTIDQTGKIDFSIPMDRL